METKLYYEKCGYEYNQQQQIFLSLSLYLTLLFTNEIPNEKLKI